jgi:serine protease Do
MQAVPQRGAGSGVIIDGHGYVVTNNHVIEDARNIKVTLIDGRVFDAIRVNGDPVTDLAVVQIEGKDLPVAKLGNSKDLQVGDWVIAIGNALGLKDGHTVTAGIVSHVNRSIQEPNGVTLYNLIQTDAAINPGNSGGALINMDAEVVGINTAIAGEAQNIGFAIAITPAMPIIEQLIKYGKVTRGWLGVVFTDITPAIVSRYKLTVKEGIILTQVQRGSPADKAGLKAGDVVLTFGAEKLTKADQWRQLIYASKPGDTKEITYIREGREYKTSVTLQERPTN